MCFQYCSTTVGIIWGDDLGGCLYNGLKLVSYFSHCIGSASLCSILKMHQRISQLQGTWLRVRACYEIRVSDQNLRAQILKVYCDRWSEQAKQGKSELPPISATRHISRILNGSTWLGSFWLCYTEHLSITILNT